MRMLSLLLLVYNNIFVTFVVRCVIYVEFLANISFDEKYFNIICKLFKFAN